MSHPTGDRRQLEREIGRVVITGDSRPRMGPGETLVSYIKRVDDWKEQGAWVPASNGTEQPFMARSGARLLYCFQPRSGKHAYLNMDTDLILTDEEARYHLGTR